MSGLLDKLNVLVRASLNSVRDDAGNRLTPSGRIPPEKLGTDIDGEVAALRKKIDEALSTEDAMKQRLDEMASQITAYDQQADNSLQRGDEANARSAVQEMQRVQQQAAMLQADLEQHRRSTSDLIEHVSTLDAMISDARAQQTGQAQQAAPASGESASSQTQSGAQSGQAPVAVLSDLLREARERVENAISTPPDNTVHHIKVNIENSSADNPSVEKQAAHTDQAETGGAQSAQKSQSNPSSTTKPPAGVPKVDETKVDEDLAGRRSRLSKPE